MPIFQPVDEFNLSGTAKTGVKTSSRSGTVSGGTVVFNLTDDNTSGGNAYFSNVYKESANFWVDDATRQYQFGGWTLSVNKKTLTMTVNQIGAAVSVLGISVLSAPIAAPNGTVVNMTVRGD